MRAPPSERTHSELPAIAADILERLRAAPAARALHHQCGGAELHRQHAAGGRRGAVDDDRAEGGRGLRRARRRAAGQSRHVRSGAAEGVARRGRRRQQGAAFPGCSIRCSSTARRRARPLPRSLRARKPRALRLNRAEFGALSGGECQSDRRCGAGALRQGAAHRRRPDRRARSCSRRRARSPPSPTAIR